jgi:hypothetical protein
MPSRFAILITTINAPTAATRELATGCAKRGHNMYAIGDSKSPPAYDLPGCQFFDVAAQRQSGFELGALAPTRSYARKAIGYLAAIKDGHRIIVETDDDNTPVDGFWSDRQEWIEAPAVRGSGWTNVYAYFSDNKIWPRGYPLDHIHMPPPTFGGLQVSRERAPIQQGLADGDPDVDAVYRLVMPLPQTFTKDRHILLGKGAWCPFNSQNTTWFSSAFPLLYLPFTCSMRMTDIYRGFIAQRVAWENGWSIHFHGPTVFQDRNVHDFMQDFREEIGGYLNYHAVRKALDQVSLKGGAANLFDDLRACYEVLISLSLLTVDERALLTAWEKDVSRIWTPPNA